jgi:hypothetical protein
MDVLLLQQMSMTTSFGAPLTDKSLSRTQTNELQQALAKKMEPAGAAILNAYHKIFPAGMNTDTDSGIRYSTQEVRQIIDSIAGPFNDGQNGILSYVKWMDRDR